MFPTNMVKNQVTKIVTNNDDEKHYPAGCQQDGVIVQLAISLSALLFKLAIKIITRCNLKLHVHDSRLEDQR